MTYRVIVTGSREFDDFRVVDDALYEVWHQNVGYQSGDKITIIQGGARGADALARQSAAGNPDVAILENYPADWDKHGKAAGPIRNQEMADSGADLVLAFYKFGAKNKGTRDMVARAHKAGIEVKEFTR